MRTPTCLFAAAVVVGFTGLAGAQPLSYTGTTLTQDFDSLPSTGSNLTWTNGTTLPGWYAFCKNGTGSTGQGVRDAAPWVALSLAPPTTLYNAGTGNSQSGGLYSFGETGNTNRTLGSVCSGTPDDISYGLAVVNDTANTYTEFTLSYKGRQWRVGGNNLYAQQLEFDYKISGDPFDGTQMAASFENSGVSAGWTRVTQLDFVNPVTAGTAAALVGTDAANTANISYTVTGISWAPGQVIYLRWFDADDTGPGDNGLGLDDVSFSTPVVTPAHNLSMSVSDSPDPLQLVGSNLTYTLAVNNVGLGSVSNTSITATFPAGVNLVSCSQGGYTFLGQNLTIPTGTIAGSSGTGNITLVMAPQVEFPANAPLNVTFTANPTAGDADVSNNSRSESTVVANAADLAVTMSNDIGQCTTTLNTPVVYTITVTNNGPAPAQTVALTDTLPSNMTYGAGTNATQGSFGHSNGVVTWNVGSLGISGSATLTLHATVSGPGALVNTAVASAATPDFATVNNTAVNKNNAPNTGDPVAVVMTSVPGSVSAAIDVPSDFGPLGAEFSGTSFALRRPFASPSGNAFVMLAETNFPLVENTVLIVGTPESTKAIAREATTVLDPMTELDKIGASNQNYDQMVLAINDSLDVGFALLTNNADTNKRTVAVKGTAPALPSDPYTFAVVARQGGAASGVGAGINYGGTISLAGMDADGELAYYAILQGGVTGSNNQVLLKNNGSTVVARTGSGIPTGQAGGRTDTYSDFQNNFSGRGFSMATNERYIVDGFVNNPDSTANQIVVVDGAVVIQENSAIAGFTESTRINAPFNFNFMENDGHWFAYGANNTPVIPAFNTGQDWVLRDGVVIARTGDPITASSTEKWSDTVLGRTYFLATGRGEDYVVGGFSNNTEGIRRVIVHNGTTVVLREGDPIDVNQNGLNDDDAYVDLIQDNRGCIVQDKGGKVLLVVVNIRNATSSCGTLQISGQALLAVRLPAGGPAACSIADIATEGSSDVQDGPDGFITGVDADAFVECFNNLTRKRLPADPPAGPYTGPYIADVIGDLGVGPPNGFIEGVDADAFFQAYFIGC